MMQVDGKQVVMEEIYQDSYDLSQLPSDGTHDDNYTPPAVIPTNVAPSTPDGIPIVTQLGAPSIIPVMPLGADATRSS